MEQKHSAFYACLFSGTLCLASSRIEAAEWTSEVAENVSIGEPALNYRRKHQFWTSLQGSVLDGVVTSSPADQKTYERSVALGSKLGAEYVVGSFGLRASAFVQDKRKRMMGEDQLSPVTDGHFKEALFSTDVTFLTSKGLEVIVGGFLYGAPSHVERTKSSNGLSVARYDSAHLVSQRFAVVRRESNWAGGFGTVQGDYTVRTIRTEAVDGSEFTAQDRVFIPSELQVFGTSNAGPVVFDLSVSLVQARSLSLKDEKGRPSQTDFIRGSFGLGFQLGPVATELKLFHQSLSYGQAAFVTFETLPQSALGATFWGSKLGEGFYLGARYGEGKDGQSQSSFNADYSWKRYRIDLGTSHVF